MDLASIALFAAAVFEILGVATMLGGTLLAPVIFGTRWVHARKLPSDPYRWLRDYLGACILLGLELLVAADIVRTVSDRPTLRGVAVLGLIVLIRTFLSFTLEVELRGVCPWQKERE